MRVTATAHCEAHPVLSADEVIGHVWIDIVDSQDGWDKTVCLHLSGKSFAQTKAACDAFNSIMAQADFDNALPLAAE